MKKRPTHFLRALFLIAIYSAIMTGPLASLALQSSGVAHARSGECTGDCRTCGCSLERRANRTCCCWQKRLGHTHERGSVAECCKKKQRHRMVMLSCNCPCGGNQQPLICGQENTEHIPCRFMEREITTVDDAQFFAEVNGLIDRREDPPDPPPKIVASQQPISNRIQGRFGTPSFH